MLTFDKKLELLRISSFLGTAPPEMLSEIAAAAHEESFDKGRFIYAKNDPAAYFYFLVQGRIGHPEVQAGDKGSLAYRADAPGQLFGFAAAVQGQPLRVISARCELPTTVLAVDGQWFQKLCTRYGKEVKNGCGSWFVRTPAMSARYSASRDGFRCETREKNTAAKQMERSLWMIAQSK